MTIVAPDAKAFFNELAIPAFDESVLLFFQRKVKIRQRRTRFSDIRAIDERLWNNLQHLLLFFDAARALSEERLGLADDADAFVSTYLAFTFNDEEWIQQVFAAYLHEDGCAEAVAEALAWMPWETAGPWVKRLLSSRDLRHKWLGVNICRLTQRYECLVIRALANREDCKENFSLYRVMLDVVGESKDLAMQDFAISALSHDSLRLQASAHRSLLLMGNTQYVEQATLLSLKSSECFYLLSPLLARVLAGSDVQQYVSKAFKSDLIALDLIVETSFFHGAPQVIPWLISLMEDVRVAQLAGFAFYYLTGIDIIEHDLALDELADAPALTDDLDDMFLGYDHSLPLPDAEKIKQVWAECGPQFVNAKRYLLGCEIDCQTQAGIDLLMRYARSPLISIRAGASHELILRDHLKSYTLFTQRLYPGS